jgi:energy-coupling factor transporter ATP-binding protein EcfA2
MAKLRSSLRIKRFASLVNDRRVVLFVGSGASISGGAISEATVSKKADQRLEDITGANVRIPPRLASLYRRLCEWPLCAVVTTNYDDLVERSLSEVGKTVSRVLTPWELGGVDAAPTDVAVIKLHGDLSVPGSVLLDQKNRELRERLSDRLLDRIHELFPSELQVFVGFSTGDPMLQSLIKRTDKSTKRRQNGPRVLLGPSQDPSLKNTFDLHFEFESDTERDAFLDQVTSELARIESHGPPSRLYQQCIESYRRFLRQVLRFGWTIEPERAVVVEELPIRVVFQRRMSRWLADQSAKPEQVEHHWLSLINELESNKLILVIGSPGSGKTTLLQGLTRQLAAKHEEGSFFPIFLRAPDLAHSDVSSYGAFLESAENRSGVPGLGNALRDLLASRRCALIVDGLDELERDKMGYALRALQEFNATFPDSRCVASSRWHGYESQLRGADLFATLMPLRETDIKNFVHHWFERAGDAEDLTQLLACHPALDELAKRPLFLSLIVYSWAGRKTAPVTPWSLCSQAVDLLLGQWDWEKGVFRNNQFSAVLHSLAWSTLGASMVSLGTHDLSSQFILEILSKNSALRRIDPKDLTSLLEEGETRTGLLIQSMLGRWRFAHSMFREYFAAHFVLDNDPEVASELIQRATDPSNWTSALAFASSSSESGALKVNDILRCVPQIASERLREELCNDPTG